MAVSYQPHAFDAAPFRVGIAAGADAVELLALHTLDEPAFDWSLDGTEEGEIICERVDDTGASVGSLVDVVRLALEAEGDLSALLAGASVRGGRLPDRTPYVGYLLPDEIAGASAALAARTFEDTAAERDRRLLLRIFERVASGSQGLYWMAL